MRTIPLLSITATLSAILPAAAPPTIKTAEPVEITRLNERIQIRFLDRKSFGISRIGIPTYHDNVRWFMPENPTEEAVMQEIKKKGLEVAVFLVGRHALAASLGTIGYGGFPNETVRPQPLTIASASIERAGLQGPVSFTSPSDAPLPETGSLLAEGRTALAAIGQGAGYDVRKGDWTVAMRPLRASNQGCIECHTSASYTPKPGDALGIVMYVYRRRD
jgi:hypothetical protein